MTENSTREFERTPEFGLRIRIVAPPDSELFPEYDLQRFRFGDIHDVPIRLGSLLILSGFAERIVDEVAAAEAADFSRPRVSRRNRKSAVRGRRRLRPTG